MKRVVITGMGAISPLGSTMEETWSNLIAGKSGVGAITLFDTSEFPVTIAAEVKNFDPTQYIDKKEARRLDRYQQLAFVAAKEAIASSGLEINGNNSNRIGVGISSGVGGIETFIEETVKLETEGPKRISPFAIPRIMTNGASGNISIAYGVRGPSFCVTSACASASDGIGFSAMMIRAGTVDAVITGGTEAGVTTFGVASFDRIRAYTSRTDGTPSPFSADRDGLVMGEGAAVLVLESLEHAKARGANILAELAGYGASADAYHITAPTEDGSGSAAALKLAMSDAKITPEDVSYINAHGTGTPLNDAAETKSIKNALGSHAYKIPVSSTKSMTGHMMGATAALEATFCINAIRDNVVPPTINYLEPDQDCDLDYVPNKAREITVNTVMSNAFGFGGHNSVLVIKRFEE